MEGSRLRLKVAQAIAGTDKRDLLIEPVGQGRNAKVNVLGDIRLITDMINLLMTDAVNGKAFRAKTPSSKARPVSCEKTKSVTGKTATRPTNSMIAELLIFKDVALENLATRFCNHSTEGLYEKNSLASGDF